MLEDIWTVFWRDWVVLRRRLTKYIHVPCRLWLGPRAQH